MGGAGEKTSASTCGIGEILRSGAIVASGEGCGATDTCERGADIGATEAGDEARDDAGEIETSTGRTFFVRVPITDSLRFSVAFFFFVAAPTPPFLMNPPPVNCSSHPAAIAHRQPFPGLCSPLAVLTKQSFSERLCRIEFCHPESSFL